MPVSWRQYKIGLCAGRQLHLLLHLLICFPELTSQSVQCKGHDWTGCQYPGDSKRVDYAPVTSYTCSSKAVRVTPAHLLLRNDISVSIKDWTGLDWTGLDWTGLDWTGLDWTGSYLSATARRAQHYSVSTPLQLNTVCPSHSTLLKLNNLVLNNN